MHLARTLALAALAAALAAPAATAKAPFTPWCGGSGESAADRQPDAVHAFQFHVVYAVPAGGADRFAQVVSPLATDIASIDAWWRVQDPTRTPRFDLASFPGCTTTFGQLDVSAVRLPHDAAYYAANQYTLLRDDLGALGFHDPDKKYLVFYDGPPVPGSSATTVICGTSDNGIAGGGALAYSIVYLGGFCGSTLGTGGPTTVIAAHELIHGLGALAIPASGPGPPHACPGDAGHPCDSPLDILFPTFGETVTLDSLTLDVGRDDYYAHHGSWWDIRNSLFLAHLDSADSAPPSTPGGLSATSRAGGDVLLTWKPSGDDVGPVTYRVYRDGGLLDRTTENRFADGEAEPGRTYVYDVRAYDAANLLSDRAEIRFKVGAGIVDAQGTLVRDTVPPPTVGLIRASANATSVILRWRAVGDAGGLRGYRVEKNGARFAVVPRPSVSIPRATARGRWTIRAVDRAGNLGPPSQIIVR